MDTETDPQPIDEHGVKHVLRFGWAAYCRRLKDGVWSEPEWIRFESVDEFWTWVDSKVRPRSRCDLYCHNTSFDLPVLRTFGWLPEHGWKLTSAIIDAPPTCLKYRNDSRTIRILDTLNFWRMSLADLGKMIGLPKLEYPANNATQEEWNTYAQRDVEVIRRACIDWWTFLKTEDMGGFAITLAGQSMRAFRHKYMTHKILLDDDERALALARESYVGGRCECFRLGEIQGPLSLFDINSMYPAVMRAMNYPTKLIGYTERAKPKDIEIQLETRLAVSRVTITTDEPAYPVRHDKRLVFPVGTFEACLSSPELLYALERGHIRKVHSLAVYESAPIFTAFVDDMYQRRLQAVADGNTVTAGQYKLLLNSLYGKFGQRGIVWETDAEIQDWSSQVWDDIDMVTKTVTHWRQFGGLVQKRREEAEARDSHPAIAAHVTAYARILLWKMILTAGRAHAYYCDTDSILVDAIGARNLEPYNNRSDLGALKVEGVYESATLHGLKDYRMGAKTRTKGVRSSATWTSANAVTQEKWSSLRGLLREGRLDAPTTRKVIKVLSRVYNKGVAESDGSVTPIVLSSTLL